MLSSPLFHYYFLIFVSSTRLPSYRSLFHPLLSLFSFIIFLFIFALLTHLFTSSPWVNLSHLYLPSHVPYFAHRSLSIFLSRRSPPPLVISNTILGSLLTLFTFTRFSPYYLHSVSCILLAILTLLSPSILFYLLPLPPRSFSLRGLFSHASWTYFRPSLRYRVNPSLFPARPLPVSLTADGDRINRRRRRG